MVQITHDNHYVPQFYLKNWSNDGNTIWVCRTLVSDKRIPYWTTSPISNLAFYRDLYTIKKNGEDADDLERKLNREFETPAYTVIEKIKEDQTLKQDDWECLA